MERGRRFGNIYAMSDECLEAVAEKIHGRNKLHFRSHRRPDESELVNSED